MMDFFFVFQVGCPVLALEVLSKIPKVTKKSSSSPLSKTSSKANLNSSHPLENGTQGGDDWGPPAAPVSAWAVNDSAAILDWSQPVVKLEDDELNLDWGENKMEEDDDEDDEDEGGLTMKEPESQTKVDVSSVSGGSKLQRGDSQVGGVGLGPWTKCTASECEGQSWTKASLYFRLSRRLMS